MRLSHKKKIASKHGLWYPRTKQQRLRREARARAFVEAAQYAAKVSAIVSAGTNVARALQSLGNAAKQATEKLKGWLLPSPKRDTSQPSEKLQCDGHNGVFCVRVPQNVKNKAV